MHQQRATQHPGGERAETAPTGHTDRRTGTACEAEVGWDPIERRLGDARSPPGLRTPRASAEEMRAGRPLVTFVALVPAAWLRRRMRETGLDGDYTLEGPLDEVGTTGRHTRKGRRPRVPGVTGRQRDVFDKLGYELQTTS